MTMELRPCILHVGQSKTGTTSIQSTLFWRLRNTSHHFVTLDSFFANRMLLAAFAEQQDAEKTVFLQRVSLGGMHPLRTRAQDFLDRSLRFAHKRNLLPILSGEAIWHFFSEHAMEELRDFVATRGFKPQVLGYLRAPTDWIESGFQQSARIGDQHLWAETKKRLSMLRPKEVISRMDRVFGRENTSMYFFDLEQFPKKCVVQHFCENAGISIPPDWVIRENESFNLHALRFVHAFNCALNPQGHGNISRLSRAVLIRILADLPGPSLRLHSAISSDYLCKFEKEQPWLRERIGREVPATLVSRTIGEGLRYEPDLTQYSQDALEWLGRKLGRPVCPSSGLAGQREIARALTQLFWRSPGAIAQVVRENIQLRLERARQKRAIWS
jgi:hypothetical protein